MDDDFEDEKEMDEMDAEEDGWLFGGDDGEMIDGEYNEDYNDEDYDDEDEDEDYDDEDEDEDYDDEDEENPEEGYDFSEDELDSQSRCMTCMVDEIKASDRWNFKITQEDGSEEDAWICRNCHSQFDSVESFNKFMLNEQYRRLYMKASTLMRLLVQSAPLELVAKTIFSGLPSVLFWTDENDGSKEARNFARQELWKMAEKHLDNRRD